MSTSLGGATQAGADCVESGAGKATYRACASLDNYDEAETECTQWGGTLVMLDSASEEQEVTDLAYAHGAANYWIGASDADEEGVWHWADGRVLWDKGTIPADVYSHWLEGEPNNASAGAGPGEDCGYMQRRLGWNDVDCTVERPFVCEKAAATAEP